MTNVHGFSDSQESAILDEATMQELQIYNLNELPILDGDVLDTENKCNAMYVNHQQQQRINIPVLDEFPGIYKFHLILNNQGAGKHCVYSELLQKIFIDMEQTLPLRFEWKPSVGGLYLRTTMVFSHDQCRSDPVVRCHNHMAASNVRNNTVHPSVLKHVVRCMDPGSIYEESGGHLSVVVPLGVPQAGSDYVPINYQFFCKNSCTSGMNRRPTELIFTLETEDGEVVGRQKLCVRVCSCPKRDKEKEEAERQTGNLRAGVAKKRKLSAPAGKKLIVPGVQDSREYTVHFKIPGKENFQAVLKQAYDLLAGQAARTGHHDYLRPYMDDLLQKMQQ